MPSALFLVKRATEVELWNEEANKLSAVPLRKGDKTPIAQALSHIKGITSAIQDVERNREKRSLERIVVLHPSGSSDYYDVMVYPILTSNREIKDLVVRVDRITDRVHLEANIIQNEKLASLGKLVASIAHEINNPLGVIDSGADNIKNQLESISDRLAPICRVISPVHLDIYFKLYKAIDVTKSVFGSEARQMRKDLLNRLTALQVKEPDRYCDILVRAGFYGEIESYRTVLLDSNAEDGLKLVGSLASLARNCFNINLAVSRAAKIVYALKSYSHASTADTKVLTNLAESIDLVLTLYQNQIKQGIAVKRDYADVPAIYCYSDELNQVWTNIIHNALAAIGRAGTLTIKIAALPNDVLVSFTDSGPGIPTAIQEKIFLPFFSTKAQGEGSGLGLSITKKIIDKHHGKVSVASVPGETTFSIQLPTVAT